MIKRLIGHKIFLTGLVAGIFLSLGVVVGLILSANEGRLPFGLSSSSAPSSSPPRMAESIAASPADQGFVAVAKAATPAVVNISTTRVIKSPSGTPMTPFFQDPFFRQFFGDEFSRQFEVPREQREQSLGSGVIVDPNGLIVTNNHVVAKADEIKVLLGDKREFKGKVVGTDPKTDIAVVKINAKDLPVIPWGDSDKLQVGEYVLAIGNPFGLNQTVTMGIVSAVGRANVGIAEYEDFIQTDAAINPGNSGGALVNVRGELIGINTAIFSQSGGYMGVGFAVPSNMTKSVMDSLVKTGKVVRGWLGVSIQEVSPELAKQFALPEAHGALVTDVLENSPAAKAGLQQGDVIISYDGKPVENTGTLRNHVAQTPVGKTVKVGIIRDKKEKELDILIAEQPKEVARGQEEESSAAPDEETSTALSGMQVHDLTANMVQRYGLSKSDKGVIITQIDQGSTAADAGLREGDLIVEMNRQPVKSVKDYNRIAARIKKQDTVLFLINRQGRNSYFALKP
ncbi:MAG TPA: DegQ family serine endoprotease [Nitrospiria bacterium]|nr:DegQ family serine endoprotease [Nitrospiria bacterium]HUK57277.1 DegQ family serine endoprotease [Nitrospiria bacterium]